MEKQTSERANVLVGIISQSESILNNLGDCSTKPSLKRGDIQRKMFDLLFYTDEGIPKSKEELTELKKAVCSKY